MDWRRVVEGHFAFLVDHGFQVTAVDDASFWEFAVTYTSSVAGIKVARSQEFGRSEVSLIRLVDGSVPPYPIWITSERIDWALLDLVLKARSPERYTEAGRLTGLGRTELEQQLAFWADSIQAVCPEFLDGDLSAIDDAAVLIRQQVGNHPQQLTAWVPEAAPTGAEEVEAAKLAKTVPPEVTVSVRRYRRGGSPA